MSDNSLHERAYKGAQMQAFFDNPLFAEAMEQVHGNLFREWCGTPQGSDGIERREELYRIHVAANVLDDVFRAYIADGEKAVDEMTALTRVRQKEFEDE